MPRLQVNPDQLFISEPGIGSLLEMSADPLHQWYLVRTKGRQERALAIDLAKERISYYLPMIGVSGIRSDPLVSPMFSGYLFLYGTMHSPYKCLNTRRAAQVLPIRDQIMVHNDLLGIERAIGSGLEIRTMSQMSKGDLCEIFEGKMKGLFGRVESVSGDDLWVSIWIDVMRQATLVRVPRVQVAVFKGAAEGISGDHQEAMEALDRCMELRSA